METTTNPFVKMICIKAQDGTERVYKVRGDTHIKKLLKVYCEDKKIEYKYVIFLDPYGNRLSRSRTIDQLGLRDGDQIDAMLTQDGGCPSN